MKLLLIILFFPAIVFANKVVITSLPLPVLHSGDTVLLQRGISYYGSININIPNVAILPMGKGVKPVVTGLITLRNWQRTGNVYVASAPSCNEAVINGHAMPLSSQPAMGYITYAVEALQGNIVYRKNRWIIDTSLQGYPFNKGWGYFYTNNPAYVTPGTWAYAGGKVYALDTTLQVAQFATLLNIAASNVTIQGINFAGASNATININNCSNVVIKNCNISLSGKDAVSTWQVIGLQLIADTITQIQNDALKLYCNSCTVKGCMITATGSMAGMGASGDGSYTGVLITGDNNTVSNSTIDSTGYIPIAIYGHHNTVIGNKISNFCFVKDDGGGIYTYGGMDSSKQGNVITGNFIANGIGASAGTNDSTYLPASGIYLDENANGDRVQGNTIVNCSLTGLQVHIASFDTIIGNVVLNCGRGMILQQDSTSHAHLIRGGYYANNIIYGQKYLVFMSSYTNDVNQFGTFAGNNYFMNSAGYKFASYSKVNGQYVFNTDLNLK